MSEYLLTDLPRYVKTTPRENFANSVVKDGAVLLFSEDGETLVAKHPDGSFTEIGSGSGGGSTEFYKCASVDTSAKTWTGYKAVFGEDGYTFSDELTEGLVYSGMTPQVDSIYDSEAFVRVAQLYNSSAMEPAAPVFYAPLMTDDSIEVNPNQVTTSANNVSFGTVDGVPTAILESGYLYWNKTSAWPHGDTNLSFSFGLRLTQTMENKMLMFYASNDGSNGMGLQVNGTTITMATKDGSNNHIGEGVTLQLDTWYHILQTYGTNGMWRLYVNGVLSASGSKTISFASGYNFTFGSYTWNATWRNLYACITRCRLYDYEVANPDNIQWLMQEIGVS